MRVDAARRATGRGTNHLAVMRPTNRTASPDSALGHAPPVVRAFAAEGCGLPGAPKDLALGAQDKLREESRLEYSQGSRSCRQRHPETMKMRAAPWSAAA